MAKKKQLSAKDRELLEAAMEGVRPKHFNGVPPYRNKPQAGEVMQRETEAVLRELASTDGVDPIEAGEGLEFSRPGLQHKILRDLRRGKFAIQGELDLHGMTRDQAYQAIMAFLADCLHRQLRCVRVIHGKGLGSYNRQPVLKGNVAKWLTQLDDVLAYCSAPAEDGGTGAVYVLLKKSRT